MRARACVRHTHYYCPCSAGRAPHQPPSPHHPTPPPHTHTHPHKPPQTQKHQSLVRIPETLLCAMEFINLYTPPEHQAALEPARRALREQKFLSGAEAAYPEYILAGTFMWPRTISPLELLEADDPVYAWRERMLDLFDGMARKAKAA